MNADSSTNGSVYSYVVYEDDGRIVNQKVESVATSISVPPNGYIVVKVVRGVGVVEFAAASDIFKNVNGKPVETIKVTGISCYYKNFNDFLVRNGL